MTNPPCLECPAALAVTPSHSTSTAPLHPTTPAHQSRPPPHPSVCGSHLNVARSPLRTAQVSSK